MNIVAIAGGVATSGVIALGGGSEAQGATQNVVVIILGLLVATASAINQVVKPGERFIRFRRAAAELTQEGWDYLQSTGTYAETKELDPYRRFAQQVAKIEHRGLEEPDPVATDPPAAPAPG